MHKHQKFLKGDTLVEVLFAVAIFGMVSVSAIAMMNKGVATAQGTLETSMARQEIDTQAEALRFIHNAYSMNASNESDPYVKLWKMITDSVALSTSQATTFLNDSKTNYNGQPCSAIYSGNSAILNGKSFVINPRKLNNSELKTISSNHDLKNTVFRFYDFNNLATSKLRATPTYPRLLYAGDVNLSDSSNTYTQDLAAAEGIWVTAIKSDATGSTGEPQYYDFYIRTCWDSISGQSSNTISTIVRLYNPSATVISSNTPPPATRMNPNRSAAPTPTSVTPLSWVPTKSVSKILRILPTLSTVSGWLLSSFIPVTLT